MMANWPLIAIRIAESFIFVLIVIGSIIAVIIPIAVAAGLSHFDLKNHPAGRSRRVNLST